MTTKEELIEKVIPSDFRMISGCEDAQTSADVSNVANFQLPATAGKQGGACTSALLKVLYADHKDTGKDLSFHQVLSKVRGVLTEGKYSQIPQLTASRKIELKTPFHIVPPGNKTGIRRALLIGINYRGQKGELTGCHNDVLNMKEYLMNVHGFKEENIALLLDDGKNFLPSKDNINWAIQSLVRNSRSGDVVYTHFSGHGGRVKDANGDELDGFDECLVPVNYKQAGFISDDDLFTSLVGPMARGVTITSVMDCCHSGSVLDLPYQYKANSTQNAMVIPSNFSMEHLNKLMTSFQESMKQKRTEIMTKEFKEFADAMLLPGEGCHGDDVVAMFRDGFQAKYKSQGLYISYAEAAKLLGDWNKQFPKANVTQKGWFMGFHINPAKVRPSFRTYGV